MKLSATFSELKQLFPLERVADLCHVDYYKMYMVPDDEVFNLSENDFLRIGMLEKPIHPRPTSITLGPMAKKSVGRPYNFNDLSPHDQWEIDKELGILDWDGNPLT